MLFQRTRVASQRPDQLAYSPSRQESWKFKAILHCIAGHHRLHESQPQGRMTKGAGVVAEQLGLLAALARDLGSVPQTHIPHGHE